MRSREEVVRRIGFWVALLTGMALVGMQFACIRPRTNLAAPGFPHASRLATTEVALRDIAWVQDGKIQKQNTWTLPTH